MDAAQALADLTEISSQIEAAVLAGADGSVVASTFREPSRGDELARAAVELVSAADEVRGAGDSGPGLVQLQAVTPRGSIFVVRDDRHVVAALTGSKPTVGLVFYDLKTCLRMLESEEEKAKATAKADPQTPSKETQAASKETQAASKETTVGKASTTRRRTTTKKKEEEAGEGS
jgi:predicted regulator of Ras-like GTPase activity (Roadblock/LC7/MglB family)